MDLTKISEETLAKASDTIRIISAEAVQKANSGHPGMPMGMAELGVVLWLKYLNVTADKPKWDNRDRFVLSNGHGSMFIYSLLHLSGYDLSLEDLKNFRQWKSKTPGHPENFITEGVEATTGPLGQGISNAVGMAIAERVKNSETNGAIDHNTWVFTGDGCLMEGVSSEASSLAGHLGLGKLNVVYDDNDISIAGHTDLAFTENVAKRYESYGWHIVSCDGHNIKDIDRAYSEAVAETEKPTLIIARTTIGKGSPNKANSSGVHGSPLGDEELAATKKAIGWTETESFVVPDEVKKLFQERKNEVNQIATSGDTVSCKAPDDLESTLLSAAMKVGPNQATRKISGAVIQELAKQIPGLIGGSADLEPSTLTYLKDSGEIQKGSYSGQNLRFGVREHGMGAIINGLAYYGGFIPFGSTFLCFTDYMRPTLRLAALCKLQSLFIYTHDSVFLGEDGPTHQPVEQIASLRAMPNLYVFRPGSPEEVAISYSTAIAKDQSPSCLIFTRQSIAEFESNTNFSIEDVKKGGYKVFETDQNPELQFVATGSEVPLAIAAAKMASDKVSVRVISMPCTEVFREQSEDYKKSVLSNTAKTVVVEAASVFGWSDILSPYARVDEHVSIETFGTSAPAGIIAEKFGFTAEQVAERLKGIL